MTGLSDKELAAAREAVTNSRPISPMTGAALIGEIDRLRHLVGEERAAAGSQFGESNRLAAVLLAIRDQADAALADDVSPAPGNRTARRGGAVG